MKLLHVGCGDEIMAGWINVDIKKRKDGVSVLGDTLHLPFKNDVFDIIYSCHLIEHFNFGQGFHVMAEWKRVLKPGGTLAIETPDFLGLCKAFIEADESERVSLYGTIFGQWHEEFQSHKFLYTPNQLIYLFGYFGFKDPVKLPALRYIGKEHINMKIQAVKGD